VGIINEVNYQKNICKKS